MGEIVSHDTRNKGAFTQAQYQISSLDYRASVLTPTQRAVKRMIDVCIGSVMLLIASPIMLVVAILIWLEDRGPILFTQERIGEQCRPFTIYKFRSMVPGADKMHVTFGSKEIKDGVLQNKYKDDPRVTRVGRIIRRASIDELPQLFNILKGDMSLVGPRPELPHLVEQYQPWQFERLQVPQGLTGWWQVNGRGEKPMYKNTKYDVFYVRNYSLLLDLVILILTIPAVIRGKGAF